MDSSGDAAISIVEFVSFIIVTKQVQIKLRLEGVIDAGSLNDATRPHQRDNRRGKGRVPPHRNLTVLTGHESTGPVDDLSVCISHAATRCGFEAIEFERWLAGEVSGLEKSQFTFHGQEQQSTKRRKTYSKQKHASAPHLPHFRMEILPSAGRMHSAETQTMLRIDEVQDSGSGRGGVGSSSSADEPLIRHGFMEAMHRTRAGQRPASSARLSGPRAFPEITALTDDKTGNQIVPVILRDLEGGDG